MNGARRVDGAKRMLLPAPSVPAFVEAVKEVVARNARWVPPYKSGTLYLRPLLFGSGAALGVGPSPTTTFCIYTSPVGNYFKGGVGEAPPISLYVAGTYKRAVPGGAGGAKAAGNYAPCFAPSKEAKALGYSETLFVDATTNEYIEEAGASNLFAVLPVASGGFELVTPPTDRGTILPGVTRASVLAIARAELGHLVSVAERPLRLAELENAKEIFCTGTGASVTAVGKVVVPTSLGADVAGRTYENPGWGEVTKAVAQRLFAIQWGDGEDTYGWMHVVPA